MSDGKVTNQVVSDTTNQTLLTIMNDKVAKGSSIFTDGYHVYKRLAGN